MKNLKIGHLRLVTSFDKGFESGLDQCRSAATKNGLLTEEICLCLLLEGRLKDAGACAADALGPGEGCLLGLAALVLIDSDECGYSLAFLVLATDGVTGTLGSDHDDVDMLGWFDRLEVDRKTVTEEEGVARVEIRSDILLVDTWDREIRHGDKDHIGALHGLRRVIDFETELLGDGAALALGIETNDHLDAALLEVEGVGVSLGTEADDGSGFSLEELQVGIFVGVDFSGHGLLWC